MNIWILVVLAGVVAMVLGPVMMLQPSTHERRQAALRRLATERGLTVSMKSLPRQVTDLEEPGRMPVYHLPAAKGGGPTVPWMLVSAAYRHEAHFLGTWAWQGGGRAGAREQQLLAEHLPGLPRSAKAVTGDPGGWSVYWSEAGGEEALEPILAMLNALKSG